MKIYPIIIIMFITACASSSTITTKSSEKKIVAPFKHILVLGLNRTELHKGLGENEMVAQLNLSGYKASAWKKLRPDINIPSKAQILEVVNQNSIDGVLIFQLTGVKTDGRFVSKEIYNDSYINYLNVLKANYQTGYYSNDKYLVVESRLYEVLSEELIFSATSETFQQNNIERSAEDFCKHLVSELYNRKILERSW